MFSDMKDNILYFIGNLMKNVCNSKLYFKVKKYFIELNYLYAKF